MQQILFYEAFLQALVASLELDHLVQFKWCAGGFMMSTIDSYGTTCIKHIIPTDVNSQEQEFAPMCCDVVVKQPALARLKTKPSDLSLWIEMVAGDVLFLTADKKEWSQFKHLPFAPVKDYSSFETTPDKCIVISFAQQEWLRCLLNINTFSGRCHLTLNENGQLELKSAFEFGHILVSRKLKGFSGLSYSTTSPKMLFDQNVVTKFAKCIGYSKPLTNQSLCSLQFCDESKLLCVSFLTCPQTRSFLTLKGVT